MGLIGLIGLMGLMGLISPIRLILVNGAPFSLIIIIFVFGKLLIK